MEADNMLNIVKISAVLLIIAIVIVLTAAKMVNECAKHMKDWE